MYYEEIRTKQDLPYISTCSVIILYNSKFILTATYLETNAVFVTRGHCISSFYRNLAVQTLIRILHTVVSVLNLHYLPKSLLGNNRH